MVRAPKHAWHGGETGSRGARPLPLSALAEDPYLLADRVTLCGEFGAVLVIVKVAVLLPEPFAAYVKVTAQLPPGATSPQLLVCVNRVLVMEAWMNVTFTPVLLVKVTDCRVVEAKLSVLALCVTDPATGGAAVPAADRLTVCGLFGALLVSVKVPVSLPELVG